MRVFVLFLTLALWAATGALALETLYIIRHAEKETEGWWDQSRENDSYRPLDWDGRVRAVRWGDHLKDKGVVHVYTSTAVRTVHTGAPLAVLLDIPLSPDDATIEKNGLKRFLKGLERNHSGDQAVLVVGHSNTIPDLLRALGVEKECYGELGIVRDGALIDGYEGLWTVDFDRRGCEGIRRTTPLE
jgi:phosphohistidine phosphatase SixA